MDVQSILLSAIWHRMQQVRFSVIVSLILYCCFQGNSSLDHDRIITLCRTVMQQICGVNRSIPLRSDGVFLCKIWDGECRSEFADDMRKYFRRVDYCRPLASRDESAELYLLARRYSDATNDDEIKK